MDDERATRVQTVLLRRLKDMPVSQLRDAAALRGLSVEIVRALKLRRRKMDGTAVRMTDVPTFAEAATAFIELHKGTWRNEKRAEQRAKHPPRLCEPLIGGLPVTIDIELITRILDPIWTQKTETAGRATYKWCFHHDARLERSGIIRLSPSSKCEPSCGHFTP